MGMKQTIFCCCVLSLILFWRQFASSHNKMSEKQGPVCSSQRRGNTASFPGERTTERTSSEQKKKVFSSPEFRFRTISFPEILKFVIRKNIKAHCSGDQKKSFSPKMRSSFFSPRKEHTTQFPET